MDKKINRYIKIYPWFSGLTGDLLFYIAVDTLFLTIVKEFTASEIVSILSISQLVGIALQFPLLFVMKKIGNTASIRIGALLLLLSALLTTVGKTYFLVLLGRIFHDASGIMKSASVVALENNLDVAEKRDDFIRIRTSANTVYSLITMLISFVASYMFSLNPYFPMIGCITTCTIGFVLSLLIKDCSDYNKIPRQKKSKSKVKINYGGFVIISMLVYAIFYQVVGNGQNEGKLFIQQHLLLDFDVKKTALIIGAIVCVSRIIRVLSNIVFAKLYKKYQAKSGIVLTTMLCSSICFILFGSFIPQIIAKILVMGLGYTIILFVRDPFNLYIQDVLFENTPKEQHQTLLTTLSFGVKIFGAGSGLIFSAILVKSPMIVVMSIVFVIAVIETILSLILYRAIMKGSKKPKEA